MTTNPTVEVQKYGQSFWLDFIHRTSITGGELQKYIDEYGILGVTSNPSIFQKAIGESDAYDDTISHMLDLDANTIFDKLSIEDVQMALDLFRPVYDRTNGQDGYVSLEVSPLIASNTEETLSEAKRLFKLVNRPNVMIKIPATEAGIPAIEEAIAAGVNINITLIFSVRNYEQVARAYIRGLERRLEAGEDIRHIASVASFFVSRIDSLVDKLLEDKARAAEAQHNPKLAAASRELMGKAAIANAKLAYKCYLDLFENDGFARLRQAGARVQRQLWASTSTKNPNYPDTLYVDELIGKDTVNTLPPATLEAFKDHGKVAPTLTENMDEAQEIMDRLAEVGINFDDVTRQLQIEGVEAFSKSFEQLISQVNAKRDALLAGVIEKQALALGVYGDDVRKALKDLETQNTNARVWAHEGKLWKDDAATIAKIENRLGWLDTLKTIDIQRLKALQASIRNGEFTHVVLLGMGGSSLAPEVLYQTFGKQDGFPEFHMLDSTHPGRIRAIEKAVDLPHTLFVVSSKSGSTIETASFHKYFYERTGHNGAQFIAITDPNTVLETQAKQQNFRDIYQNPADIGGRFSALSYFGLVPAALMGLDLDHIRAEEERMVMACGPAIPAQQHPGMQLGAILGVMGKEGRDKVIIHVSPSIASFGNWVEQLLAESTGKEGKGLLPVVGGTVGKPHDYDSDRLLIYLRVEGDPANDGMDDAIRVLRQAGQPCVTYYLPDRYCIAGEFFRWEYATAIAGKLLDINPFDEPNVTESKENTARLLAYYQEHRTLPSEKPVLEEKGVSLFADEDIIRQLNDLVAQQDFKPGELTDLLAAMMNSTRANDYFALLAYLPFTPALDKELNDVRRRLRHTTRRPATVGYGPIYLHSTGQLHKGGPNNGNFILLTGEISDDIPVPDAPYTFGILNAAQAAGDIKALSDKNRRVVRLHSSGDALAGIKVLLKAIGLVEERRGK